MRRAQQTGACCCCPSAAPTSNVALWLSHDMSGFHFLLAHSPSIMMLLLCVCNTDQARSQYRLSALLLGAVIVGSCSRCRGSHDFDPQTGQCRSALQPVALANTTFHPQVLCEHPRHFKLMACIAEHCTMVSLPHMVTLGGCTAGSSVSHTLRLPTVCPCPW
jgi:hypothetical protein